MENLKQKYKIKYSNILIFEINENFAYAQEEDSIILSCFFNCPIYIYRNPEEMVGLPFVKIETRKLRSLLFDILKKKVDFLVLNGGNVVYGRRFEENKYNNLQKSSEFEKQASIFTQWNKRRIRMYSEKRDPNLKVTTALSKTYKYHKNDLMFENVDEEYRKSIVKSNSSGRTNVSNFSEFALQTTINENKMKLNNDRCLSCSKMFDNQCDGLEGTICIGYRSNVGN